MENRAFFEIFRFVRQNLAIGPFARNQTDIGGQPNRGVPVVELSGATARERARVRLRLPAKTCTTPSADYSKRPPSTPIGFSHKLALVRSKDGFVGAVAGPADWPVAASPKGFRADRPQKRTDAGRRRPPSIGRNNRRAHAPRTNAGLVRAHTPASATLVPDGIRSDGAPHRAAPRAYPSASGLPPQPSTEFGSAP